MSSFITHAATVLRQPKIGAEYAWWVAQKRIFRREPTRQLHGVTLGGFNGFSEYHTAAAFASTAESIFLTNLSLSGEGVVLDVGANLGLFSLLISKRDRSRRIFSFEPNPSTFEALKENVSRNGRHNIACFQTAIAAHDGAVRFASRKHARANASIEADGVERSGTLQVACETLDTFCQRHGIGRIAILKVDVEGYETLVFKGASRILAEVRPELIYFEVCPGLTQAAGFDAREPARLLTDKGFELKQFGMAGDLIPASPESVSEVLHFENWIAVPMT
jgi:FkbM family methyltransferase